MFENFKSDIIYYNTPADFELEFNLCGCYRKMRLLQDKCSDKKTLLLSLSRAVSRSRIIIITADLFSADEITNTIAASIGSEVEVIDNNEYGIKNEEQIAIIKNSLPLVTYNGVYGGCIIESGPQTLILLDDDKAVRKTIMKDLIHPYIEEFTGVVSGKPKAEEEPEAIEEPDTEEIITEEDDYEQEAEFEDEDALTTESQDSTNETIDLYTEPEFPEATEELPLDIYDEDEAADYFTEEIDEPDSPLNLWLIIISVVLLVALAVLCFCIFYVPTKSGVEPAAYLKDVFDTMFG